MIYLAIVTFVLTVFYFMFLSKKVDRTVDEALKDKFNDYEKEKDSYEIL